MTDVEAVAAATFFAGLLVQFGCFDWVLQRERTEAHDQWVADGEPFGYLWQWRWEFNPSRQFARDGLAWKWLFRNPNWAASDQSVANALTLMRAASGVGLIAWLVLASQILGHMLGLRPSG